MRYVGRPYLNAGFSSASDAQRNQILAHSRLPSGRPAEGHTPDKVEGVFVAAPCNCRWQDPYDAAKRSCSCKHLESADHSTNDRLMTKDTFPRAVTHLPREKGVAW